MELTRTAVIWDLIGVCNKTNLGHNVSKTDLNEISLSKINLNEISLGKTNLNEISSRTPENNNNDLSTQLVNNLLTLDSVYHLTFYHRHAV